MKENCRCDISLPKPNKQKIPWCKTHNITLEITEDLMSPFMCPKHIQAKGDLEILVEPCEYCYVEKEEGEA